MIRKLPFLFDLSSGRSMALATASSLAISIAMAPAVIAQEAEEGGDDTEAVVEDENVIIVTGFKASLESAQNIKRDSDTFVDAITAEDIGALPDRSVAESLQRVPGVNIGRFEKTSDPDRFSVEGTGVIIRGLPFVRSELNGRDIFSATGGRVLSFNDVSPELLGRVEVFKNVTADMIDGGIAGTVNLITRKPLDNPGFRLAGTIEANIGDLAEEWSPGFSLVGSGTVDTDGGSLGFQLGYAQSELVSRTDASQLTDPCYRTTALDATCIRTADVSSGGVGNSTGFDASNFPPAGTVVAPKGAGVRTTDLKRDREAWSAVFQYESPNQDFLMTFEWLRAETRFFTEEFSLLALVNNDAGFPVQAPGNTWTFDSDGLFQTGILTQSTGDSGFSPFGGLPLEMLRFQRATEATTEDFSFDVDWEVTDRLRLNLEAQHIKSDLRQDSVIGAMASFADVRIDNTGNVPQVEFLAPAGAPANFYSDPNNTYFWFLLDSQARNDGELDSFRADLEYDISDDGFFKKARFGARWADRNRVTRDSNFGNWGNLGAPWTGRGGNWNCGDPQIFGCGGAYAADFPGFTGARNPFADGFQRGNTPLPIENGGGFFYGGDDFLGEYLNGTTTQQGRTLTAFTLTPNAWNPINSRFNEDGTPCTPFCQSEISDVTEKTKAAYVRVDFGQDFSNGWNLAGNIGLRYVDTRIQSAGEIGFPRPDAIGLPVGMPVTLADIQAICANAVPGQVGLEYCDLSDARKAEFAAAFTGGVIDDSTDIKFDHWLPSFNARLDTGGGLIFRAAVSKGISRPDLSLFQTGGTLSNNVGNLVNATLETGPLFTLKTGNRSLRPISSWNYDLSAEWYFDAVGSLTVSAFLKDISGIINTEVPVVTYTGDNGESVVGETRRPGNNQGGTLKGVEVAYQQTYDFLPGLLSGLGTQLTYTYVDGGAFTNADLDENQGLFSSLQPLAGISEHTFNATVFYEKGPVSARAAYNWRSDFLITPRDDIFPFSPIWQESGGQLDASIFFNVTDGVKVGVQGVNLLDQVTRTSQVVDFDGTRLTRSAFRNDRRFTFLARFDF